MKKKKDDEYITFNLDWKYISLILAYIVLMVLVVIPKIELTVVDFIGKQDKQVCECNCYFNEEKEINWIGENWTFNFSEEDIGWGRSFFFNLSGIGDHCLGCLDYHNSDKK